MNDLIKDVEVIENVLKAFVDVKVIGEEQYSAYHALTKLYIEKKDEIAAFDLAYLQEDVV